MIYRGFSSGWGRRLLFGLLALAGTLPALAGTPAQYAEGEVIVTFKSIATKRSADTALEKKSLRFERHFSRISKLRQRPMGLVRNRARKTEDLIRELKADPSVESVEPNYLRWVKAAPNDSRFNEQWALRNTGQTVDGAKGTLGVDIKFVEAWAKARPTAGEMVVAVIDTGVDTLHPELAPRMWTNPLEIPDNDLDDDGNGYKDDYHGYDFVDDLPDPADSGYHGTHVAGTIAAQGNNGQGVVGINDHVKIMALKVSNDGDSISTSAVIEALDYAVAMKQRGVPLVAINASYGGGGYSNAERDSITAAGAENIVLCAAAGNETANNDTTPSYPASYRLPNMIVVASTTSTDALSDFSNYGRTSVDLAAPGSSILSTRPSEITVNVGSTRYISLPLTFGAPTSGLTGRIYDCGIGQPNEFPSSVSGHIALISRGTLTFAEKVANAKAAGAIAAVIYNNEPGLFLGTLQTAGPWIPARTISREAGLEIRSLNLPANGGIEVRSGFQFLDGTSMAAPHVTGAVAFAALNFPTESATQRVQRILVNVDKKTALQNKLITGGRLNLDRIVDTNQDGTPDWQPFALAIVQNPTLKGGLVGVAYEETFTLASVTAPVEFTVSDGSLPTGLSLSLGGVLSGTPTQAGTSVFTLLATDDNGNTGGKQFTLNIAAEAVGVTTVAPLPVGTTGTLYQTVLSASGGMGPYTWNLQAGSLPEGLELSTTGVISGLPSAPSDNPFTLKVTDAHQRVAEKEVTLSVLPSIVNINTSANLPYGVKAEAYNQAFSAEGGTAPYTWTVASGPLPAGLQLTVGGLLQGKPTAVGIRSFRIQVADSQGLTTSKIFSLNIQGIYTTPVMNPLQLGSTAVGANYQAVVSASNYPRSYAVKGLPKGLVWSAKTGSISGRPKEAGTFTVLATATNPGGRSAETPGTLIVRALDNAWIGSFYGWIERDASANQFLGSRFTLTTTSLGAYTLKVTTGATSKSAVGFLSESHPQINATILGSTLHLNFEREQQLVSGTHGSAEASGWRSPWNAKSVPASQQTGYYSAALDLSEQEDQVMEDRPQGSGYLAVRVTTAGLASITGRTATGETVTSSCGLGAAGQAAVYQSLYKHKGSLIGSFAVEPGLQERPGGNSLAGRLSWLKPGDGARSYGQGFGPLPLRLAGGYLAPKSSGSVVRGLPVAGSTSLTFTDGGLGLSDTEPDVLSFEYTATQTLRMPLAGSTTNPARATLLINKASGTVSGSFMLTELNPTVKRKVNFLGMIVPQPSGEVKARGYFVLPQLPEAGEKASSTAILSGGVQVRQPPEGE